MSIADAQRAADHRLRPVRSTVMFEITRKQKLTVAVERKTFVILKRLFSAGRCKRTLFVRFRLLISTLATTPLDFCRHSSPLPRGYSQKIDTRLDIFFQQIQTRVRTSVTGNGGGFGRKTRTRCRRIGRTNCGTSSPGTRPITVAFVR